MQAVRLLLLLLSVVVVGVIGGGAGALPSDDDAVQTPQSPASARQQWERAAQRYHNLKHMTHYSDDDVDQIEDDNDDAESVLRRRNDPSVDSSGGSRLRIIGGTVVPTPTPWPWLGYLVSPGCGVNAISDRWVVTAAHCVLDGSSTSGYVKPTSLNMGFGCLTKGSNSCKMFGGAELVPHPCHDPAQEHDDIALIKLTTTNDAVSQFASMDRGWIVDGMPTALLGWGATDASGFYQSSVCREVTVPIASQATCEAANPFQFENNLLNFSNVFCTGGEAGKDSCTGDSGGPAVIQVNGTTAWLLAGLASFGSELPENSPACAVTGRYGVYTKISSFAPWVDMVMDGKRPTCDELKTMSASSATGLRTNFHHGFIASLLYSALASLVVVTLVM